MENNVSWIGRQILTCLIRLSTDADEIFKHMVKTEFESQELINRLKCDKYDEYDEYEEEFDIKQYILHALDNKKTMVNVYKKYWRNELKQYVLSIDVVTQYGWLNALKIELKDHSHFYIYCNGQIEIPVQEVSVEMMNGIFKFNNVRVIKGDMEQSPSIMFKTNIPELDVYEVGKYGF